MSKSLDTYRHRQLDDPKRDTDKPISWILF